MIAVESLREGVHEELLTTAIQWLQTMLSRMQLQKISQSGNSGGEEIPADVDLATHCSNRIEKIQQSCQDPLAWAAIGEEPHVVRILMHLFILSVIIRSLSSG